MYLEKVKQNKALVITIAVAVIICIISFVTGQNVRVHKEAVKQVREEIAQKDTEIRTKTRKIELQQETLDEIEDFKANKEAKNSEIEDLAKQVEAKQGEINSKQGEINTKQGELDNVIANIASKQAELDKLTGAITKAKAAPKVLPAGEYSVGTDLPEGRYSVTGSSNFIVYDTTGDLKVNTILGRYGNTSYTCNLSRGDQIRAASKMTFTPVE